MNSANILTPFFFAGAKYVLYEEIRTRCPHLSTMPSFLDKVSSQGKYFLEKCYGNSRVCFINTKNLENL